MAFSSHSFITERKNLHSRKSPCWHTHWWDVFSPLPLNLIWEGSDLTRKITGLGQQPPLGSSQAWFPSYSGSCVDGEGESIPLFPGCAAIRPGLAVRQAYCKSAKILSWFIRGEKESQNHHLPISLVGPPKVTEFCTTNVWAGGTNKNIIKFWPKSIRPSQQLILRVKGCENTYSLLQKPCLHGKDPNYCEVRAGMGRQVLKSPFLHRVEKEQMISNK